MAIGRLKSTAAALRMNVGVSTALGLRASTCWRLRATARSCFDRADASAERAGMAARAARMRTVERDMGERKEGPTSRPLHPLRRAPDACAAPSGHLLLR